MASVGAGTSDAAALQSMNDQDIEEAVAVANVPALLMVLFQCSGDEGWLQHPYLPRRPRGLLSNDSGGLPEALQTEIRVAAGAALRAYRDGKPLAIALPGPDLAVQMMSVCVGEELRRDYGPLLVAELERRADLKPTACTHKHEQRGTGDRTDFRVIVIGVGVAGIAAANELEALGVSYVILEKQHAPGGVWEQTRYPGASVDTPSHLYSFAFRNYDWRQHFERQEEIQSYLADTLQTIGAMDRVRYEVEVERAEWDTERSQWNVVVRDPSGARETLTANVVISAVGSLNRPKRPSIHGLDAFEGPQFHSAEWPEDFDHRGKRVAVVGTGASSMQIVATIAPEVEHLTIFQRSPQWVAPFEHLGSPIDAAHRGLLWACSLYRAWYWVQLFWEFGDKVLEGLRIDPNWSHPERSVNARNDGHREFFTRYIESRLGDRTDLLEKVLPSYPPYGKRILLDNGWYDTLLRDNVTLVDEAVSEIRGDVIVSTSGDEFAVDAIVWATGFESSRFVASLDVRGIDAQRLRDVWDDDDPYAYLGMSVPGFPNFFMLGGPNSFPGSGSFMFLMEMQARYLRELFEQMMDEGIDALDAREDVTRRYIRLVDEGHERTVWTHPGMDTYYRNSRGRVVFLMPFLNIEYWKMIRRARLDDYTHR